MGSGGGARIRKLLRRGGHAHDGVAVVVVEGKQMEKESSEGGIAGWRR